MLRATPDARPGGRTRIRPSLILLAIVAIAGVAVVRASTGADAVDRPFGARFSLNAPGHIDIVANTLMTCSGGGCAGAQSGTNPAANNNFAMVPVDTDGDPGTTISSSATLNLAPGATVEFAGLYFGARSTAANRDEVLFATPTSGGYVPLTATQLDAEGSNYNGFVDVTALVQAGGAGVYTTGGIRYLTGAGRHGGWALVVVVRDPNEPFRNLTVFDGWEQIRSGETSNIPIAGFLAPPTGPVQAEIGFVAYEGDASYVGDFANLDGQPLTDAQNPATNFFNGRITTGGVSDPGRNPGHLDQLGFDAVEITTSGIVSPGATAATVQVGTNGDWFYPAVVTTAIDIYVPDLSSDLTKSVNDLNGGDVLVGDLLEYTIRFTNSGEDGALDVEIEDPLPAGVAFVPGSLEIVSGDNPGSYSDGVGDDVAEFDASAGPDGTVRFRLGVGADGTDGGEIQPSSVTGALYEMRYRVKVGVGTEGTTIENIAGVTYEGETTGQIFQSPSSAATVDVVASANVALLSKTDSVDPVVAGSPLTYTIVVGNEGPSPADGVELVDTLPPGVTFDAGTSDPRCGGGPVVTCNLGTLAAGTPGAPVTDTVVIGVTVDPNAAAGAIQNQATVSSTTTDTDPTDQSAAETTSIVRRVDIEVAKTATADPVPAGGQATFDIQVTNNGPSAAANPTIYDALPAGTTLVSATPTGGGTCTASAGTFECTWATLAPTAFETVAVVLAVPSSALDGTVLTNQVKADSDDLELPGGGANADGASTTVTRQVDLELTKATTSPVVAGDTVTWEVTLTNNGPSDASGVSITDLLPGGATFAPAATTAGCTEAAGLVTCPVGALADGDSVTVQVGATLPSGGLVTVTNVANAISNEAAAGPATATDPVTAEIDLGVTKAHDLDPASAGANLAYTLTVTNDGPSDATNVSVTDTLPAGVTIVSLPANCTPAGADAVCTVAALAAGGTVAIGPIEVSTDPASAPGAILLNSAVVTADQTDTDLSNNTTTLKTQLERLVELDVFKDEVGPDPVAAGAPFTYRLTVVNRGPSADDNVVLVDDLGDPANPATDLFFVSGPPGCSNNLGLITCNIGAMPPEPAAGSTVTVDIVVMSRPDLDGGQVENIVTADGDFSTPVDGVEETTFTRVVDLAIAKDLPAAATAGSPLAWTITVTNNGPSTADNVVVTDLAPIGMTIDGASGPGATCLVGGTLSCTIATLAPGATVELDVTGSIGAEVADGAVLTNTATVSSDETEADPSDNTAQDSTTVGRQAALSVAKALSGPAIVGDVVAFTVTVTNDGPSDAANVRVFDTVPAGVTFNPGLSTAGCLLIGPEVRCDLGDIAADDAPVSVTIAFDVPAGFADPSIENTAVADSPDSDPATATVDVPLSRSADLRVAKSTTSAVTPGQIVTWSVVVTNDGPSAATGVSITDNLPAGAAFSAANSSAGCAAGPANTVVCPIVDLLPGQSHAVVVGAALDANLVGSLTNSVTVAGAVDDPVTSNNTASVSDPVEPRADLQLTKTMTPDPAIAGQSVTVTLSVANGGPSSAADVTVTDTLPPSLTFLPGGDPRCTAIGQDVTCTEVSPLSPGAAPVEFTFQATVRSDLAAGTFIDNTATATSTTFDPTEGNNTSQATLQSDRRSDLTITKVADTSPVVAGGTLAYTITVTNNGPSFADNVQVVDTPGPGVVIDAATVSVGSCTTSPTTATCSIGTLAVGASAQVIISATTASSLPDGATVSNAAVATSDEPDPTPASVVVETPVVRVTGLGVDKEVDGGPVGTPGTTHPFQITIVNTGLSDATGVEVSDVLPAGTTFDAGMSSVGCTETAGVVTCPVGALPSGAAATIVIGLALDPSLPEGGVLDNTVTVSGLENDDDPDDDTSTVQLPLSRLADIGVVKSAPLAPVVAGTVASMGLSISNDGPSDATNIVVSDAVPAGLTFSPADSTAGCAEVGGTVTCTVPALAAGAAPVDLVLGFLTDAGLAEGLLIDNVVNVNADEDDPTTANNTSEAAVQISRSVNLELHKTADASPIIAGSTASWTLTATNLGPSDAGSAVVVDTLPAGATFTTVGSSPECGLNGGNVECVLPDPFVAGATVAFTVVAEIDDDLLHGSQLKNTATLSADTGDPSTSTSSTPVVRESDLVATKSLLPAQPVSGEAVTYTVSITNDGPSLATFVEVVDLLPPEVTVSSITNPATGCVLSPGLVSCSIAALSPGDSIDVVMEGTLASFVETGTTFTNQVNVQADEVDPDPSDNAATADGVAERAVDVSITKAASAATAAAGSEIDYTIGVLNTGPSYASGVTVTDSLPVGMTFVSAGSSPLCGAVDQDITCTVGVLPDGVSTSLTIRVAIAPGVDDGTVLTNSAEVAVAEPNSSGQTQAEASVTVEAVADLRLDKEAVEVVAGGEARWRLTVTNNGPSSAPNTVITDELGDWFTFAGPEPECAVSGNEVSCPIGDLEPGETAMVELVATVDPAASGTVTNTATVTSDADDPVPAGATDTETAPVERIADLAVSKVADVPVGYAGTDVVWTIAVENAGPSTATGVTLTDLLPSSVELLGVPAMCSQTESQIECSLDDLAPGQRTELILVTAIPNDAVAGQATNQVSLAHGETDPDLTDNQHSAIIDIDRRRADLQITKVARDRSVRAGEIVEWVITVRNDGPDPLPGGIEVHDPVPRHFELFGVESSSAACRTDRQDVFCTYADTLEVGESFQFEIRTSPQVAGTVVNRVYATADAVDPTAGGTAGEEASAWGSVWVAAIPATGPSSTVVWTLLGLLLIAGGATLLWLRRRPQTLANG